MDDELWRRYRRALDGRRLPAAFVDLDALERNVERFVAPLRAAGKQLRIATKSLRCPALVREIARVAGSNALMTYTAEETAWWAREGFADLVLAYPTLQRADLEDIVAASCAVVVDCEAHVEAIAAAARGATVPLVVELDVAWRRWGLYVGVRRSPLHDAAGVVALARKIAATDGVRFAGVMAYDAHIAGVPDSDLARRAIKRLARRSVESSRAEVARALADAGLAPGLFNGGGSGSIAMSAADPTLTEVTIGSGFLAPLLFDDYRGLSLEPAALFALQVVRRPADGLATCHGGGYIASGAAGRDRLPRPVLPVGCRLLPLEGAGEVQTPIAVPDGVAIGDPVMFRHAKAGELAEHFNHYLFVRGDKIVDEAPTWRGLGKCFLG